MDWLQQAGSKILDIGGAYANKRLDLGEEDTADNKAKADFPWQKIALIAGGVVALALVLRFVLKKG